MTISRWETGESKHVEFPCENGEGAVAHVPGRDAWLVAMNDGNNAVLGAYAFEGDWLAPFSAIGDGPSQGLLTLSSNGEAATVLWGYQEGSRGVEIPDVGELAVQTTMERRDRALESDGGYVVVQLDDRAIVVGAQHGLSLWSSVVRDGKSATAVPVAGGSVYGHAPRVAYSDELGLLAVCYQTFETFIGGSSAGIAVVVIDREGRAVSEPLAVSEDNWNVLGYDLAWSENALLVAWGDIMHDDVEERTHYAIMARRLVVDGLR
jgi:hypothetical protein